MYTAGSAASATLRGTIRYHFEMARILFFSGKVEDDRGKRFRMRTQDARHPDSLFAIIARRLGFNEDRPNDQIIRSALIRRALLRGKSAKLRRRRWRSWIAIPGVLMGISGVFFAAEPVPYLLVFILVATGLFLYCRQFRRWEAQLPSLPNVCVVCIYDLTGIPPESDGCTVCPECGGAWKLTPGDPD